jgi:hypothetical protein
MATTTGSSRLLRAALAGAAITLLGACADSPVAPSAPMAPEALPSAARLGSFGGKAPTLTGAAAETDALLACPSTVTTTGTAVIGRKGGVVRAAGSELIVTPGAVDRPTKFTFVVPASPVVEVDIRAGEAEHFEFKRPVLVSIDYSRCAESALPKTSLAAWYIDPSSRDALGVMGGVDDRKHRRLTFLTDHLSGYAVAYRSHRP